ncbi:ester cyclase [Promicromonospora sp. NPDC059942]|uniref:ester cyclase n=1 Tax=Promicromonospora sp. NPDC059942 TaxID=3347009 RepID=UPI003660A623
MNRFTGALMSGDLDTLRELYAADVVVTTPDAGTLHGIDAFIGWNQDFVSAFSDRAYHSERELETDDSAIDQGELVGTHTSPMKLPDGQSVPPTGKQVHMRGLDIATVSGGKIVRHDFYFDQLDLLTQLGLAPTG